MSIGSRILSALALISVSNFVFAHPGPPHTHAFGDELSHLLPAIALIVAAVWIVRRNSR